jgi:hypothetical protein
VSWWPTTTYRSPQARSPWPTRPTCRRAGTRSLTHRSAEDEYETDTLMFRVSGTADSALLNGGLLIDDVTIATS